jgi:hypothetical protein
MATTDDPITDGQREVVEGLLGRPLAPAEREGFLIVSSRFVDRFGGSRIGELENVFCTRVAQGREALAASLARVFATVGSYADYERDFPVTISPPLPAFPLFPIIGIRSIRDVVYRVLDRGGTDVAHVKATGHLPERAKPAGVVSRTKPWGHWCSYEKWATPAETRRELQVLPQWGNCEARATLTAAAIEGLAFVAYSVDPSDQATKGGAFHGYFFESRVQDHDQLDYEGTALQICVFGAPAVAQLEEWNEPQQRWLTVWSASRTEAP